MPLTNNVRVFRQAKGKSVREVARIVGMSPSQLSKVERDLRTCEDESKLALARYFGVSVTALFFQEAVSSEDTKIAVGA